MMRIPTHAATKALVTQIASTLDAASVDALVTTSPEAATPAILDGTPAVILTPPTVRENQGPALTLEWEMPIVGAPIGDEDTAWDALDAILSTLDQMLQWTTIRPITWSGAQTAAAPAYLITFTQTIFKEANNA